jgi:hypothetical protein
MGTKDQLQVLVSHHGLEVGVPGVEPLAVSDIELHPGHALDVAAVVVLVEFDPGLLGGLEKGLLHRVGEITADHVQQTGPPGFLMHHRRSSRWL